MKAGDWKDCDLVEMVPGNTLAIQSSKTPACLPVEAITGNVDSFIEIDACR
jgi:hypothetical protein